MAKEKKSFMVVRVLWLRGETIDKAISNYLSFVSMAECEATEAGVLPDMEIIIRMEWNEDAKKLYEFLKFLGKKLSDKD